MANVNRKTKQSEINKENFGKLSKTFEIDIKSIQDQMIKQLEIENEKSNDNQKISEQENGPVTFINDKTVNNQNPDILEAKDSNDVTLSCDAKQIKTHKEILDLYKTKTENPTKIDDYEKLIDKINELENDQLQLNEEKSILLKKLLEEKSENENLKTIIADLQQCGSENSINTDMEKEEMAKQMEQLENKLMLLKSAHSDLIFNCKKISTELHESQGDRFKLKEIIMKLEEKNFNLNSENLVLKEEIKEKELKVNVLIDNIQTIVTSFRSIEKDFNPNADKGYTDKRPDFLKTEDIKENIINTDIKGDENSNENETSENVRTEYLSGSISKSYSCHKCKYSHYRKSELQEHMKLHTQMAENLCNKCGETFPNEIDIKQHMNTHLFTCNYCEQTFNSKTELINHNEVHHRPVSFQCMQCDKQFQRLSDFQDHKRTHLDPSKFSCESCTKIFKNSSDLTKHKTAHTNKKFCHMYNNFQRCKYESFCVFLHESAPYCKYDGFCTRPSCQYKHKYGCLEKNFFLNERKTFMRKKEYNRNVDNLKGDEERKKTRTESVRGEYVIP